MEENNYYYEKPHFDSDTQQTKPPSQDKSHGLATASLILGICSLVLICCGIAPMLGALGILLALLSRGGAAMSSRAKSGLILSVIGFVLSCFLYVFVIVTLIMSADLKDILEDYQYYYEHGSEFDEDDLNNLFQQYRIENGL